MTFPQFKIHMIMEEDNAGDQNAGGGDAGGDKATPPENTDNLLDLDKKEGASDNTYKPGTKPEGLPDDLWDAEKNTFKADALYNKMTAAEKQAKDLREKMGRRGAPPATADEYKVEIPEDAPWKDLIQDDDAFFKEMRETAHKLGLSQGQFGPLAKAYMDTAYKMQNEGAAQPAELTEEQKAAARDAEIEKIGPNGPAIIKEVSAFVRENIGVHFDEQSTNMIKAIASTAEGIKFLNQVREMVGGERVPMGNIDGAVVTGLPSDKEIMATMATDAYQKGDPATLAQVDKWISMREKAGRGPYMQA